MDSKDKFIEVENRIRALTTVLKNLNYHVAPSSSDPKNIPSFLRHFANILTTGDSKSPEARKVVAVTGSSHPDGRTSTLVVTQYPFSQSAMEKSGVKRVLKSQKSFDEIVDLKRDDDVDLDKYISELWTALAGCQSPDRYTRLHIFVIYRSYRRLFNRVTQDEKTWKVHIADKILTWTPEPNELSEDPRWFIVPDWLSTTVIFPEEHRAMKIRKTVTSEFNEIEFSNATLGFWSWLLGTFLSKLEDIVKTADGKKEQSDLKEDVAEIAERCYLLHCYVNWSARIVETLLTRTSLAKAFNLPRRYAGSDVDDDDSADMSHETGESDGHLVLRHLRAILAWSAAVDSLTSSGHLSIINGKLDIGLVQVPYTGHDIAGIEIIIDEFFKRFPHRWVDEFSRARDTTNLRRSWTPNPKFTGTTHAEATLMGLLAYFSEPDTSRRMDHWNALQDPKIVEHMEVLIGPWYEVTATNNVIGVGEKCCWCCGTLGSILSQDKQLSIKLPGSHGIVYPWSPPRVGLDIKVLQTLEERLWTELYSAICKAEFGVALFRQSSGPRSIRGGGKSYSFNIRISL